MDTIVGAILVLLVGLGAGQVAVYFRFEIFPRLRSCLKGRWSAKAGLKKLRAKVPGGGKAADLDCTV